MQETISNLIEHYSLFVRKTTEYTAINDLIKSYVKKHNNHILVDYYSLTLKYSDNSIYSNDIIPYLKENKQNSFIKKNISTKKVYQLLKSKSLSEELVLSSIEREKTILDIKLKKLPMELEKLKETVQNQFSEKNILQAIQRRECLKLEIDDLRGKYYLYAKQAKDAIRIKNNLEKYRFQYKDDFGVLQVKSKEIIYSDKFLSYLIDNDIDAIDYTVDSKKLLKSKNKKLDRAYLEQYKNYLYSERLYVDIVAGVFHKKIKYLNN